MYSGVNRISEFKQKEVINISDGRRLGFVEDVEINLDDGRLDAIVIPGPGRVFGHFFRDTEYIIPWEKIRKIGDDIILVDMDERFLKKYFDKA